ncbi:MAG: uroporphyrinogen-III synthase [Polaromonas sp.]|nr:uroporphyrinogen-III synthase [Polaromonas sp.]
MPDGVHTVRVIVTRPAREAERWVQQFQQGGVQAEALPLIEIAPAQGAANAQALRKALQMLDTYAACMFVSGNAVDHFFTQNSASVHDENGHDAINGIADQVAGWLPPGLRLLAPGPGTVAALVAAGIPAGQIDAPAPDAGQFDSPALWDVIGQRDWQGRRVLVVRGENSSSTGATTTSKGRNWIARQWEAAGAQVDFVSVYQRRAPRLTNAQLELACAAGSDGSVWLFSSTEAVVNLASEPVLGAMNWRGARAVATHPRIVDAVRAAGWGVVVASRPAFEDIKDALASIESLDP